MLDFPVQGKGKETGACVYPLKSNHHKASPFEVLKVLGLVETMASSFFLNAFDHSSGLAC